MNLIKTDAITTARALAQFENLAQSTGKFRACYLTGSLAEGYQVEGASDIDLTLIASLPFTEDEKFFFDCAVAEIDKKCRVNLDVSIVVAKATSDGGLDCLGISFREAVLSAKLAGRLIWGNDVLAKLQGPTREEYLKATAEIPFEFSDRIRGYKGLRYPLEYPQEDNEFRGYVLMNDRGELTTKPLISLMTWIGTATVAHLSGVQVGNKRQCIAELRKVDRQRGDELSHVFDKCRRSWKYRVPEDDQDRKELGRICDGALGWENRYALEFFSNKF